MSLPSILQGILTDEGLSAAKRVIPKLVAKFSGRSDNFRDILELLKDTWSRSISELEKLSSTSSDLQLLHSEIRQHIPSQLDALSDSFDHRLAESILLNDFDEVRICVENAIFRKLIDDRTTLEDYGKSLTIVTEIFRCSFIRLLTEEKHNSAYKRFSIIILGFSEFDVKNVKLTNFSTQDEIESKLSTCVSQSAIKFENHIKEILESNKSLSHIAELASEMNMGLVDLLQNVQEEKNDLRREKAKLTLEIQKLNERLSQYKHKEWDNLGMLHKNVQSSKEQGSPGIVELIEKSHHCREMGQFIEAVIHAREAEELDAKSLDAKFALAYALELRQDGNRKQDLLDAIARYEEISFVSRNKDQGFYVTVRSRLGLSYLEVERYLGSFYFFTGVKILEDCLTYEVVRNNKLNQSYILSVLGMAYFKNHYDASSSSKMKGLHFLRQAMRFSSRFEDFELWSMCSLNLANALVHAPVDDPIVSFEEARKLLTDVLNEINETEHRVLYSQIMTNLGNAYLFDPLNLHENKRKAILAYVKGLSLRVESEEVQSSSKLQNNIGICYCSMREENLSLYFRRAMRRYRRSLRYVSKSLHPNEYAKACMNIGNCIRDFYESGLDISLLESIEYYYKSADVFNLNDKPYEWARMMRNVGWVYHLLGKSMDVQYYDKALECYDDALEVVTSDSYPQDWLTIVDRKIETAKASKKIDVTIKTLQEKFNFLSLIGQHEYANETKKIIEGFES
ncbi:MAG: hypothetical protein KDC26_08755 [Armatimonadetes bacterium]|nr:hypothetical protein [Armatimonadota bacterium]